MAEKEIAVSTKHVKLRIVLTISFLIIAVASITIGVVSMGHKDPGYYSFNADYNDEDPLYRSGYQGVLYFSGNSNKIKSDIAEARAIMSDSLLKSYRLFNEKDFIIGLNTLGDLNNNPNQEVALDPVLYAVLDDALTKTNENKNYSLYSGPLYDYWEKLANLGENAREANDPKNSLVYKADLENLVKYCSSTYVNLELKGDNKAILHVEEEYLNYLKEEEITSPIVSLNILKDAYRVKLLLDDFANTSFQNGYFTADPGLLVSLKEHHDPVYTLYDNKKGSVQKAGKVNFVAPSCASSLYRFSFGDYATNYVLKDGTIRNMQLNIETGYGDEQYLSSTLFAKDNDIVNAAYLNNYLSTIDYSDLNAALSSSYSAFSYVFCKNEEALNVYATNNLSDFVTINEGIGYNLSII